MAKDNNNITAINAMAMEDMVVVNLGAKYCDCPGFVSPTGELGGWEELRQMRDPDQRDSREVLLDIVTSYEVAGRLSEWVIVRLLKQVRSLYSEEEPPRLALSKGGGAHLVPLLRETGFRPELIYDLRDWTEFGNPGYGFSRSVLERDWGYIRKGVIQEVRSGFEWDKIPFETRRGDFNEWFARLHS